MGMALCLRIMITIGRTCWTSYIGGLNSRYFRNKSEEQDKTADESSKR